MSVLGWRGGKLSARKSPRRVQLQLEALEDRTVPAVFAVGAGDVTTLIADIAQANGNGQSNTINLTAGTYDLTAVNNNTMGANGLPAITSNLTINGNGAVIERDGSLGSNTPFRLFYVSGGQTANSSAGNLTLENLTLEGGLAQGGNSLAGGGLGAGGAIFNQGTLVLNGVTVTQNSAIGGGGVAATSSAASNPDLGVTGATGFGIGGASGGVGGVGGFGAGNGSASGGGGGAGLGGAIFNLDGTTTLINSTLAANLAQGGSGGTSAANGDGYGGAIFNLDGTVNVTSSTLASNSIAGNVSGGGGIYNLALGTTSAGQPVQAAVNLTDSILANSVTGNDLINDQSSSTTNSAVVNATTPNIVMALSTINGATTNGTPNTADPLLGKLGSYGGLTPTMPLLSGSPALGVGVGGTSVPSIDQRGNVRGSVIDLGAFQQTGAATLATTTTVAASNTSDPTQPVTLTATVTATVGATPTGSVQFVDTTTGTTLGSATLSVVNGQTQATLTSTLSLGTHTITATYQTDGALGGSTASTSFSVGSSNQIWLQQTYHDLLHRDVDPTGLTFWTAALNAGTPRGAIAYYITQSTEYFGDQIQAAFQTLLNRPADTLSLNYFIGLMQQGQSIEQIESYIAGSGEYFQGHGGGTNDGFLAAVYQDFLHRSIDSTSLQTGEQALTSQQATFAQVVQAVLSTTEYRTDVVQNTYQTYLHRAADTTSLSAFVGYLASGGSDSVVTSFLIGSPEYLANVTA